MLKQRLLFLTVSIFMLLMTAGNSFACGGLFCQNVPVSQQAERIIFTMNGDGTISAYVQINYTGEAPDFSWVVPVPTVPDVDVAEMATFDELDLLTQPIILSPQIPQCAFDDMPVMAMGAVAEDSAVDNEVIVLASGTAGPYGYDVVDSPDPDALVVWLRENDYQVTEEMEPLIHVYNEEGMPFLAMKLQPEAGVQDIQPIVMTYESDAPMIPIRLTAVAAQPDMNILTWIFADAQAIPENYAHITIADDDIRGDFMNFGGTNYLPLLDAAIDAETGLAMTTEYAQPTSELANIQPVDPLLQELVQDYDYVTRLLGRMSPEEMTLDPIFGFDEQVLDVSNVRDLRQVDPETFWSCSDEEDSDNQQNRLPAGTSLAMSGIVLAAIIIRRRRG